MKVLQTNVKCPNFRWRDKKEKALVGSILCIFMSIDVRM